MRTLLLLAYALTPIAFADEPKKPAPEPSAAQKAFGDSVRAAQKVLRDTPTYTVAVEAKWKLTGGKKEQSGTQTVRVAVANPDKMLIEVGSADEKDPHLLVTADGKSITRYFAEGKLYSASPQSGSPLDELQADGVTVPALRAVGVDFLARPNMLAVLIAQTLSVEDLGVQEGGSKLRGYRLTLVAGPSVVVRFASGERPVPVELSSTLELPVAETKTYTRTLTVKLTWDFTAKPSADTFTAALPSGAKQVDDLSEAILAPELDDVLGKPAPDVEFAGLDGKPVKLSDYAGKSIVVLYAWATWAAPEGKNLPALNEFVKAYSAKGVTFVAVNAGDTPLAAKQFANTSKYSGIVALDPKGTGLAALRVATVPAVVVIGKDGTIQAVHRGKPDTADKVKADLDKLLRGESIVPKK
jgi:peroxiredoxin